MANDFDRLKQSVAGFIRTVTNRIDYLALYAAKVVSQNADKTLELQPDDARLPGLSSVPINLGIPGATVLVAAGSRVLVFFANGDPSQPRAALWESSTLNQIILTCGDVQLGGGTQQFVALGDQLTTALNNVVTWLTTHTHIVPGAVGGGPGLSSNPSLTTAPTIGTVKSASVKVKT